MIRGALFGLAGIVLFTSACEPSCKQTCRNVLACDLESDRVTVDECEAACVFQERLYEDRQQDALRDRLGDHKRCLNRESCDDLADGVCFDDELFAFSPDDSPE
ncbi:MAG: hypothetical protein AB8H79_05510 [Myxococcota bacterium]